MWTVHLRLLSFKVVLSRRPCYWAAGPSNGTSPNCCWIATASRLFATHPQWSPIIFVPPSKDTSRKTVEQKLLTNRSHEEAFRLHTAPWRGASPPDLPFRNLRTHGERPGCESAFEPAHQKKGL